MADFKQMMNAFGVVTVMNACIYKLQDGKSYVGRGSCVHGEENSGALKPSDFVCTGLYLDTLKIANLNQEGPTKTITGGQYANPLLKYGKTMTLEMQDALGRAPVLAEFFGCDYKDGVLSVTDKFPGAFAIEGDSFFIDQKTGDKVPVHIFIPQFLPDAILSLTQDAEGDAAVFDLNGTISVTSIRTDNPVVGKDIVSGEGKNVEDVFYQVRETSWFHPNNDPTEIEKSTGEDNYHEKGALAGQTPVNGAVGYERQGGYFRAETLTPDCMYDYVMNAEENAASIEGRFASNAQGEAVWTHPRAQDIVNYLEGGDLVEIKIKNVTKNLDWSELHTVEYIE